MDNDPHSPPLESPGPSRWRRALAIGGLTLLAGGGLVLGDWLHGLPDSARATYVGRQRCVECHPRESAAFHGSHHDRAMDRATSETVLGDFSGVELEHYGIVSRMFQRDGGYWVHTEGPDGQMADFEVKYVFGVEPLQQYMVEFDRTEEMPEEEIGRLQVLRISWDTTRQRWFYLSPPDVDEKLPPDDDLHWTGVAQRWNTMCADCHSTDLRRGFDVREARYHTTFAEIDVSCEACHGPGSLHVQLANSRSLFWDRKRGYALARLKDPDNNVQIDACAQCHSRRQVLREGFRPDEPFYDYMAVTMLGPQTYHCDGQVLDEVYVHGSFLQSKMYHKSIRCTDCHDPHTARLKHSGNQVCTSCHQHTAAKYDAPGHHNHKPGSAGAQCVNCHMPSTTYMDVDPRRDHSLRVPRPDVSLRTGAPNACTGCHLDRAEVAPEKRERFGQYKDYLLAASPVDGRPPDAEVGAALRRVDAWSAEHVERWFPDSKHRGKHFAESLLALWRQGETAVEEVDRVAGRRDNPAIIRASALYAAANLTLSEPTREMYDGLSDPSPMVRGAAAASFGAMLPDHIALAESPPQEQLRVGEQVRPVVNRLAPLLDDDLLHVRLEAARALSRMPPAVAAAALDGQQRRRLREVLEELKESALVNSDRGGVHAVLGSLYESQEDDPHAAEAYRTAIRIEPNLVGPRTNLAALLERNAAALRAEAEQSPARGKELLERADAMEREVRRLRSGELKLLARDARLAPYNPDIQHRYGLSLYLDGQLDEAERHLEKACELSPQSTRFLLLLLLLERKQGKFDEALSHLAMLMALEPQNRTHRQLLQEIRQEAANR